MEIPDFLVADFRVSLQNFAHVESICQRCGRDIYKHLAIDARWFHTDSASTWCLGEFEPGTRVAVPYTEIDEDPW